MTDETKRGAGAGEAAGKSVPVWLIGWLFTLGYAQLPLWKAILAVLIWPYFLGAALR